MAVIARNKRSQEEIYNSLGLKYPGASSSGPSGGNRMIDATPGYVTARNPVPSASQVQGMPSNPISFNAPSAAGIQGITVGQAPGNAQGNGNTINKGGSASQVSARYNPFNETFKRRQFNTSGDTDEYYDLMRETEENRPEAFQSRYEGAIQNILDGILNGNQEKFDINKDANYQALYDLYSQQYQANANRGMRDTMGAMQAATGGYGSTAATAAAGQAYDRAMEGLNDRNMQLMQMAYQMYGDAQADRYRQLGAVTGLDDTDYARYRDTVGDWQADRNYYANQYQNFFGNDYNQYQFDVGMDWNEYQDRANRAWQEFEYGDQRDYQRERDAKADYDAAFNRALSLAQSGMGIPSTYGSQLEPETLQQLNALAAQVQAQKAAAAAGGSGGGSRRRSSGTGPSNSGPSSGKEQMTLDQFNSDVAEILYDNRDNPKVTASQVTKDLKKLYQDNGIEIIEGKYTENGQPSIGALRQAEYSVDTTKATEERRKKSSSTTKKKK